MATVSFLFIMAFILVQGVLGIVLLYRGYKLLLETIEVERLVSWFAIGRERLKAAARFVDPTPGWRRVLLIGAFFIPGSLPFLLLLGFWRIARRFEPGVQWSRLKTAIQNIAI